MKGYPSKNKQLARIVKKNMNKFAAIECKSYPNQVLFLRLKQRHIDEALSGEVTRVKPVRDPEVIKALMKKEQSKVTAR